MTKTFLQDLTHQVSEAKGALRYQLERLERFTEKLAIIKYTNMKLHEVASSMNSLEYFEDFCREQFEMFQEYLASEAPLVKFNHLGRSSSFYFSTVSLNIYDLDPNDLTKIKKAILTDSSDFAPSELLESQEFYIWYTFNCGILEDEEDKEDYLQTLRDGLQFFADNLEFTVNRLDEHFKQVRKAYQYLNDFKKNQLEIWDDSFNAY